MPVCNYTACIYPITYTVNCKRDTSEWKSIKGKMAYYLMQERPATFVMKQIPVTLFFPSH